MTAPDQQAGALLEAWRNLAAPESGDIAHLRSATLEGIPVEPLYLPATTAEPLVGRGPRPWAIVEIIDHERPEEAHDTAAAALKEGATGLAFQFAPHSSGPGLRWFRAALDTILDQLDLDGRTLRLEPHARSFEIAGGLAESMAASSDMAAADISFGLNPVALAFSADAGSAFASAWRTLVEARPLALVAEVDGRPYHEAGAGEALELAAILAEAAFALRALDAHGIAPERALDSMGASIAADHDQFLSIAKLRALRLLFARVREVAGAPPKALRIHAETSRRMLTARDPHNNLVRATIAAFAAGVGGADSIAVAPYDAATGEPSPAARRLARNTQHLLLDEAHISRVADPACGSGAVESLTASLCEHAWAIFQSTESDGGVLASLADGTLARELAAGRAALSDAAAAGRLPIVGVSVYAADSAPSPIPDAELPAHPALAPMRLEAAVQ